MCCRFLFSRACSWALLIRLSLFIWLVYIKWVIIFGLIWFLLKKIIKLNFFNKKTETGLNRPVLVRFSSFLRQKSVQTGFARFGSVFTVFFWFGLVFSGLSSVLFFQFQAYKTELNRSVFFHGSVFSVIFFPVFSI